jgi:hypothetical protein
LARDDWYRCKDWTPQERATFDEKIARSRSPWSKWQYFTCQAGLLFFHGRAPVSREEALRLLERSLTEVADIEPEWAAQSLASIGECELALGRLDQAELHLREARERCPRKPKTDVDSEIRALLDRLRELRRSER